MLEKILVKEIIAPIVIIIVSFIVYKILCAVISRLFLIKVKKIDAKRKKTVHALVKNVIKYFIIVISFLMILEVYGIDTKSIITSLGVVGVVAGLALQDILKDFISGAAILFENQYSVGDVVTINGFKGEVVFLGIKTTKIKAYTGEVNIIANRMITEVINHTIESSLAIVDIGVAYNSDLEKVDKIINQVCEEATNELENLTGKVECIGIQQLAENKIVYRITVTTKPQQNFGIERILRRKLKDALTKNNIEIPVSQVVIPSA